MQLKEAVEQAAGRAEVRDAVAGVYADLQSAIDTRKPLCKTSGRCCRFEEFGHRLYVTTIELAVFWGALPRNGSGAALAFPAEAGSLTAPGVRWDGSGCPFQIGGLCSVHPLRPFGCRIFFCDASSTDWQTVQYERFHGQIKRLHEELSVPYFYLEWRDALARLDLLPQAPDRPIAKTSLSLPQVRL